jgi:hypothetical protein
MNWYNKILGMIYMRMLTYNKSYAEKLLQIRPSGSQWGTESNAGVADGIERLNWTEYTDTPIPGMYTDVRYFNVSKENLLRVFPDATQDILPLDYLLEDRYGDNLLHVQQCIDDIDVVVSPKTGKYELQTDYIESKPIAGMDHIRDHEPAAWLAVGDAEDKDKQPVEDVMIWMIHPGELMPKLPPNWDGQMSQLIELVDYGGDGDEPTFSFPRYAVKGKQSQEEENN